jgi:hypothetical protein
MYIIMPNWIGILLWRDCDLLTSTTTYLTLLLEKRNVAYMNSGGLKDEFLLRHWPASALSAGAYIRNALALDAAENSSRSSCRTVW